MSVPTPLAPGSPKLARRRYHANVFGARNERGAYPFIAEGRFTTQADAIAWVDANYPDAPNASVTFLSARDNWLAHPAAERRNGAWS